VRTGAWLLSQLDIVPDDPHRFDVHEYLNPEKPNELAKVMFLHYPAPQRAFNELVTTVRAVADVQKIFTHSGGPQGIAFAGDTAHVRTAEWLLQQLDVQPDAELRAAKHSFSVPFSAGETARIYFLPAAADLVPMATAIRSEIETRHIFTFSQSAAVALRGTPDVIAVADKVFAAHEKN